MDMLKVENGIESTYIVMKIHLVEYIIPEGQMARTIGFQGNGFKYCPVCRKVYYEKDNCNCDIIVDAGIFKHLMREK
jgi:hypothetical protein